MNYSKILKYNTEDFILDDNFVRWVLNPNQESNDFWNEFIRRHPKKKQQVEEAIFIIKTIRADEPSIPSHRLEKIYKNAKISARPSHKVPEKAFKIAAIFIFLLSISGIFYYLQDTKTAFPIETFITGGNIEKGRVILPDGTINEFETEQTQIQQMTDGELTINSDTVLFAENSAKNEKLHMAHVIIPYGKRSEITLADGTRIWLNAGSQLSYPVQFAGNKREVYLEGEAFFEVESNPKKPFYVVTHDLKIRVTGTRFNVTSYASDQTTQAILLSGKIGATRNKRFGRIVEVQPGELIEYNKADGNIKVMDVDVELYSSWINGYLVFDNEPVENIFKKLERYYNKKILTEKVTGQTRFTGKLELTDNVEKVLKNISFSASFSVESEDGTIIIKK